jgi:hypothetical protein
MGFTFWDVVMVFVASSILFTIAWWGFIMAAIWRGRSNGSK